MRVYLERELCVFNMRGNCVGLVGEGTVRFLLGLKTVKV